MMKLRWLIDSLACATFVLAATAAYAGDAGADASASSEPAEVAHADAPDETNGGTSEVTTSEATAASTGDAAEATTAKAEDKKEGGGETISATADVKKKEDTKTTTKKVAAQLGAQNVAIAGGDDRPFFVAGSVQFRTPVVSDADPAGERSVDYALTAGFKLTKGVQLLGRLNLRQRFVAESGQLASPPPPGTVDFSGFDPSLDDSAFRLGNLNLGVMYFNPVDVEVAGIQRNVFFIHRGMVYLPTSREAQVQNFYLGLEGLTVARTNVIDQLYVAAAGLFQWRGHEFAEQAGLNGATLPRFVFVGQLALEYLVSLGDFGTLTVGADINGSQTVNYPARDSFESENSDAVFVRAGYGYDFYVTWVPLPFLSAGIAWEQGGNVVRNGIVNTFFFHRDETRLAFALTARY